MRVFQGKAAGMIATICIVVFYLQNISETLADGRVDMFSIVKLTGISVHIFPPKHLR